MGVRRNQVPESHCQSSDLAARPDIGLRRSRFRGLLRPACPGPHRAEQFDLDLGVAVAADPPPSDLPAALGIGAQPE